MALVLMSSDMHLVWPDWRSNRSDWTVFDINPRVKRRDTSVNLWIAMGFEERERVVRLWVSSNGGGDIGYY